MKNIFSVMLLILTCILSVYANGEGDDDKKHKKDQKSGDEKELLELKKTKAQPDVPGALVIDLATTILLNSPDGMDINPWGSWTVNIYYLYEFPIGKSNFSMNMGFGLGLEKYKFKESNTLGTTQDDTETILIPLTDLLPKAQKFRKSIYAANYFDIPVEFRFYANKNNRRKSFKVAVGGKVGFRFDTHTKIRYDEFNQTKILKDKQQFNTKNPRFGLYGRLGFASVSFYYYYSLTEFFDNKKGPDQTQANTMLIGISIFGF